MRTGATSPTLPRSPHSPPLDGAEQVATERGNHERGNNNERGANERGASERPRRAERERAERESGADARADAGAGNGDAHNTCRLAEELAPLGGPALCLPFLQLGSAPRAAAMRIVLALLLSDEALALPRPVPLPVHLPENPCPCPYPYPYTYPYTYPYIYLYPCSRTRRRA